MKEKLKKTHAEHVEKMALAGVKEDDLECAVALKMLGFPDEDVEAVKALGLDWKSLIQLLIQILGGFINTVKKSQGLHKPE